MTPVIFFLKTIHSLMTALRSGVMFLSTQTFSGRKSDFLQFIKDVYETSAAFLLNCGLYIFKHAKEFVMLEYNLLLFGLGCALFGAFAAVSLREFFWYRQDKSSAKLKKISVATIKNLMTAIKNEYIQGDSPHGFVVLPKIGKLARKKSELQKWVEKETGSDDVESEKIDSSFSRAEVEIRNIDKRIKKLQYRHKKLYENEARIAAILNRQFESVSTLLTEKFARADFGGREAELGIRELNGNKYLLAEHILHKGKLHVRDNDEIDFELRFIPDPGTVIELREKKK